MALSKDSTAPFSDVQRNVVTLRSKIDGVSNLLPKPNIEAFDSKTQIVQDALQLPNSSKVFDEELDTITTVSDDDTLGVSHRQEFYQTYTEGEVRSTNQKALWKMVDELSGVKGDTGCLIDKRCVPSCSMYTEEVHFISFENLCQGSFGKVDLCYDSETKEPFARKTIQKSKFRANEVFSATKCGHPNITKLLGLVQRDSSDDYIEPKLELYFEYGGDSLTKFYSDGRRCDEMQIRDLTKQGLAGLVHMSLYDIVHLDIKPDNLLIIMNHNGNLQLKITDLGSSRLPSDCLEFVGTPEYTAPEVWKLFVQTLPLMGRNWGLTVRDITGKVDVFAFALVIMYMYLGYHIIIKVINNGNPTYGNIGRNQRKTLLRNLMLQMTEDKDNDFFVQKLIPDVCSLDMRNVLMEMTHYYPVTRVSALQALRLIEDFEHKCKTNFDDGGKMVHETSKQKIPPSQTSPCIPVKTFKNIPVVAEDCTRTMIGHVKNSTIDKLRWKLKKPYKKDCLHSEGSKCVLPMSPLQEMDNISKKLHVPATPVAPIQKLCFGKTVPCPPCDQRNSTMIEDKDNDFFVQKLIPDVCSLDMRNVLMEMTHYYPVTRVSALQALRLIEDFEHKCKTNFDDGGKMVHETSKQKIPPSQTSPCIPVKTFTNIPVVAEDCTRTQIGHVKNSTINKLRRKLKKPYKKDGLHSKGSKCVLPMSPLQEMDNISKKLHVPATPIAPIEKLCFGKTVPCPPCDQRNSTTTHTNLPLIQSPTDNTNPALIADTRDQKGIEESGIIDETLSNRRQEVTTTLPGQQYIPIDVHVELLRKMLLKKAQNTTVNRNEYVVQAHMVDLLDARGNNIISQRSVQDTPPQATNMPMDERGDKVENVPNFAYIDPNLMLEK